MKDLYFLYFIFCLLLLSDQSRYCPVFSRLKQVSCTQILFLFFICLFFINPFLGVENIKEAKDRISIQEKLGDLVSLDAHFFDENNKAVKIIDYFKDNKKPVILTPVYYSCPHFCNYIFQGLVDAINQETKYILGKDYNILSVSINHKDRPDHAKFKKKEYLEKIDNVEKGINNKEIDRAWSLLTGEKEQIKKFYDSVGFRYKKDQEEYAHTASLIFITPKGRVARYLYGISFNKNDFRLAILETSKEKISSFVDQVFFYCFRYDSVRRAYTLVAWKVMIMGSLLIVILLTGLLAFLWVKEYRKKNINTAGE